MELKQLQYFLTVAKHLNFSRAAESLYISQPALSYQIAELERELGVNLFVRDRRRVYLTPVGSALIESAQNVLNSAAELQRKATSGVHISSEGGYLEIGFDVTEDHFESTGVTEAIAGFSREYSNIKLGFQQMQFAECIDLLTQNDIDVAFIVLRHNESLPPELSYRIVHTDRLVLIHEKNDEIKSCRDVIERYSLVLVSGKPRGRTRILKGLSNLNLEPDIITVDSIPASFVLAQAGMATMVLPENYFNCHHYEDLQVTPIPDEAAEIAHAAVWNKSSTNPSLQLFMDFLEEKTQEKIQDLQ
ncbi:MAG: LysR family transcriptional regulator [Oscillospiraceae bacterium]